MEIIFQQFKTWKEAGERIAENDYQRRHWADRFKLGKREPGKPQKSEKDWRKKM